MCKIPDCNLKTNINVLIENDTLKDKLLNYLNSQGIGSFTVNETNQKFEQKLDRINVSKTICCKKKSKSEKWL